MYRKIKFIIIAIVIMVTGTSCKDNPAAFSTIPVTSQTEAQGSQVSIKQYYRITENKDETYTIRLYDKDKKVVDELTVSREPHITIMENNVIQVIISYGSPFYTTYFYNTKDNKISNPFDTPVLVDNEKIVYIEGEKLIISDIFDKELYYKEIKRNFSQTVPPSSAVYNAKLIDKNMLQIGYYEGEEFYEKTEVIDLNNIK